MKNLFLACILSLIAETSFAQGPFELGVYLGAPTGVSGKMHLGNNRSIDAVVAHSMLHDLGLSFHSDYIIEKAYSFDINAPQTLDLYFGFGARLAFVDGGKYDDDLSLGPRVPVGLSYNLTDPNLVIFGELALVLEVTPDTDVDVDAGVGVRYRF